MGLNMYGTFAKTTDAERGSMIQDHQKLDRRIKEEKKFTFAPVNPFGILDSFENELEEVFEDSVDPYMNQISERKWIRKVYSSSCSFPCIHLVCRLVRTRCIRT